MTGRCHSWREFPQPRPDGAFAACTRCGSQRRWFGNRYEYFDYAARRWTAIHASCSRALERRFANARA